MGELEKPARAMLKEGEVKVQKVPKSFPGCRAQRRSGSRRVWQLVPSPSDELAASLAPMSLEKGSSLPRFWEKTDPRDPSF